MFPHPCFNEDAHDKVGRVHLPVAPHCNIQCAFCERRICINNAQQHPGWTRKVIKPYEALELVNRLVKQNHNKEEQNDEFQNRFVVGVAGPGEPLANEETFETLYLIHQQHPTLRKCISTNGLMLEQRLSHLLDAGVSSLTVTVNAPDSSSGKYIYRHVKFGGRIYRGEEAAALLIEHQQRGIKAALAAGLVLKVNTVLIPGINDVHVENLAQQLSKLGVRLMNLMPLIPSGAMRNRRLPTCDELRAARIACEKWVKQFRACQHCSADIIYMPEKASVQVTSHNNM